MAGRDATPEQFFVYHEFKAAVYQHVLTINPREYEARYWVEREHRLAVQYGPPDAAQRVERHAVNKKINEWYSDDAE